MSKELSKTYFPGLNGLRFLAALFVIMTHVEFSKKILFHGDIYWLKTDYWIQGTAWQSIMSGRIHWISPFITECGYIGLIFFFVLSGFLITYLLLEERRISDTIAVKKFYIRRVLRIWPLYYLIIILGLFVLPHIALFDVKSQEIDLFKNFGVTVMCYLLMFPNLAFAIVMEGAPNIGHLWSVGVEEQFYLLWPLVLKFTKKPFRSIIIFMITVLAVKVGVYIFMHFIFPAPELDPDLMISSTRETVKRFIGSLKFESMALGGIGACLVFYKKQKLLDLIYAPWMQVLAFLSLPAIILFTPKFLYGALYLFFSVPFLIIILNVGTNDRTLLKLRGKVWDYLGKITYGIYGYHMICIVFVFHVLDHFLSFPLRLTGWQTMLLYVFSIPLTILVSMVSYTYFEKKFINRKRKYTTVISGDDAKEG